MKKKDNSICKGTIDEILETCVFCEGQDIYCQEYDPINIAMNLKEKKYKNEKFYQKECKKDGL